MAADALKLSSKRLYTEGGGIVLCSPTPDVLIAASTLKPRPGAIVHLNVLNSADATVLQDVNSGHQGAIIDICFSGKPGIFLTSSQDATVRVHNLFELNKNETEAEAKDSKTQEQEQEDQHQYVPKMHKLPHSIPTAFHVKLETSHICRWSVAIPTITWKNIPNHHRMRPNLVPEYTIASA